MEAFVTTDVAWLGGCVAVTVGCLVLGGCGVGAAVAVAGVGLLFCAAGDAEVFTV